MATKKQTIEFLLAKLRESKWFSARAMFGEYALYADGKVVALVYDDLLHVKILFTSHALERLCKNNLNDTHHEAYLESATAPLSGHGVRFVLFLGAGLRATRSLGQRKQARPEHWRPAHYP
ncbi:MAG: hypothetical protein EXS36_14160 [Pedosphaera sp.]|nr:hypothetical protein [Pedosphaera sp.]